MNPSHTNYSHVLLVSAVTLFAIGTSSIASGQQNKDVVDQQPSLVSPEFNPEANMGYTGERRNLPGPYKLHSSDSLIRLANGNQRMIGGWSEIYRDSRPRVVAFCSGGLQFARDIYFAYGPWDGGTYQRVFPTGLVDNVIAWYGGDLGYQGELLLDAENPGSLSEGKLTIRHHVLKPGVVRDALPGDEPLVDYVSTTISMPELLHDTDDDGLTDIAERMLFLDPDNPDTDGDGIEDWYDCTPNANPALMGPVERGIARALYMYLTQLEKKYDRDWMPEVTTGNPWQARYFIVYNAGPVAFAWDEHEFSICLSGEDQSMRLPFYQKFGSGSDCPTFEWIDRRADPVEGYKRSRIYQYYVSRGRSYSEKILREEAESWQEVAGLFGAVADDESDPDAVLEMSFDMGGEVVLFDLVNGEFLPTEIIHTWVE